MLQFLCLFLALLLCLTGCGGTGTAPGGSAGQSGAEQSAGSAQTPATAEAEPEIPFTPYQAPPFAASDFHEELSEGSESVRVDLSAAAQGYVALTALSDSRLKVQITKDEVTYTYDLPGDGTATVYPLQDGSGSYSLRVMENVVDNKYAELYATSCEAALADEFQPFLRPNQFVDYGPGSRCVKKAAELAASEKDALGVVAAIYTYICDHVRYDTAKAASVTTGYLPDPDETMQSGLGICFDYAALAAAMLRSQGIPTKMIFGYVSPDGLYHAWNMFYTAESGWITVSYQVSGESWNRLDLTFSANGTDVNFIGDGTNYSDLYCY